MPFQNICCFEINQVKDRPVLFVINYTTCYNKIFMNKLLSAKKIGEFFVFNFGPSDLYQFEPRDNENDIKIKFKPSSINYQFQVDIFNNF